MTENYTADQMSAANVKGLNKDAIDLKAPWSYEFGNADNPQNGCVYDSDGKLIHLSAMVTVGDAARLRLIAAAPTMYNFVASRAGSGDNEAIAIMEAINGNP